MASVTIHFTSRVTHVMTRDLGPDQYKTEPGWVTAGNSLQVSKDNLDNFNMHGVSVSYN